MTTACDIAVRFHEPPVDLARYFTTFYRADFSCPDGPVHDALQPEWGGVRFFDGKNLTSRLGKDQVLSGTDISVMGPSSQPVEFEIGSVAFWGIGLLPLGWARFMSVGASDWANRIGDGRTEADFAHFLPLRDRLSIAARDEESDLAAIVSFFRELVERTKEPDERILAIHEMLLDPDLPNVAAMAESCGMNPRTMERLCRRHFGFPPKLLLRRQRFMRSLSKFMLDPSLGWIGALDSLYFDQSHFVRDCHTFLGMSPSEYAARPHPILSAFMRERLKSHGSAVQTLDKPG
ncbi:AraC family transcriptional regulator [Erythrobacter sp. HKB08]|uniref:helix-turn-helix domain-containing protein n=1 Tax=Erythrobacter sp. HKB08 TaxID=2502843 RepID=UPI0010092020|nr:helix-turn-helix domain-containing protein [Erythrobacter sp. HKB08]